MSVGTPVVELRAQLRLTYCAWAVILVASQLPDVISHTLFGVVPEWLVRGKLGFLLLVAILCFCLRLLRPLLPYVTVLMVFLFSLIIAPHPIFITLLMLAALWALKGNPSEFFLVAGNLRAPIEPVPWLGIKAGKTWALYGWVTALAVIVTVPLVALPAVNLSLEAVTRALSVLPIIVAPAALNAFNEEVWFRAAYMSTLPQVVGKSQALAINAFAFGVIHYLTGLPGGLVGALYTGFFGWIAGKYVLETRGLLGAWLIHFAADVVLFALAG